MCGISGIIGRNIKDKETITKRMTDAISHRGPDDAGFYSDEYVSLGMRRLSIIDLDGGKQPIYSQDKRYLIFFNGEIYNYKELKEELLDKGRHFDTQSDTEVILAMYEVYGRDAVKRLRGMFAFAIYDTKEHKLFLARDFFGIKPLYYVATNDDLLSVVAYSSEIKSFLSIPDFKPQVNDQAVFNYLSYQYNPLEETFFKGVFKLPPAHFMEVDLETGKFEISKYWQFKFSQDGNLDRKKTERKILETMEDSVKHHMIADVSVGSFLSGGIDSSIIATLMYRFTETKVKTFTVGFESVSEGNEAKETADPLGTDHREISIGREEYFRALPKVIWHFDEPVADPSALGLFFLSREARKHVKVVLSGEGSDEFFGGYNIYLEPFARKYISWIPRFILKSLLALPIDFRGRNYINRAMSKLEDWYIGNASIFVKEDIDRLWRGEKLSRFNLDALYSEVSGMSDSTKMQYTDINTWLVGDILAKADKMTMAHSLELRVPFLDIEVANLASLLPDKFKWKGFVTKYLLREAFKKILPETVRKRKKLGFPTPVGEWIKSDITTISETILSNSYIERHMNIDFIQEIIDEHRMGKKDNSRKIYLLLSLALWYNIFIENSKLKIEN